MEILFFNGKCAMNDLIFFPVSHVEERKICTGLKEQAIMIEAARLFGLREELLKQLNHTSIPEDKKREIENLMTANEKELSNVHLLPTKVLFDVPPSAFDWNKISVENVWFVN
jgi:hypothetical protein